MNHDSTAQAQLLQSSRHGVEKLWTRHAKNLRLRLKRIDQGAQQVEHRANPQGASQRCQIHKSWMPGGSEQEGDTGSRQSLHHLVQGCLEVETEPLEHIG